MILLLLTNTSSKEKWIEFMNVLLLFDISATSEGSIPMAEGEELQVIELDQGDGWTR